MKYLRFPILRGLAGGAVAGAALVALSLLLAEAIQVSYFAGAAAYSTERALAALLLGLAFAGPGGFLAEDAGTVVAMGVGATPILWMITAAGLAAVAAVLTSASRSHGLATSFALAFGVAYSLVVGGAAAWAMIDAVESDRLTVFANAGALSGKAFAVGALTAWAVGLRRRHLGRAARAAGSHIVAGGLAALGVVSVVAVVMYIAATARAAPAVSAPLTLLGPLIGLNLALLAIAAVGGGRYSVRGSVRPQGDLELVTGDVERVLAEHGPDAGLLTAVLIGTAFIALVLVARRVTTRVSLREALRSVVLVTGGFAAAWWVLGSAATLELDTFRLGATATQTTAGRVLIEVDPMSLMRAMTPTALVAVVIGMLSHRTHRAELRSLEPTTWRDP